MDLVWDELARRRDLRLLRAADRHRHRAHTHQTPVVGPVLRSVFAGERRSRAIAEEHRRPSPARRDARAQRLRFIPLRACNERRHDGGRPGHHLPEGLWEL